MVEEEYTTDVSWTFKNHFVALGEIYRNSHRKKDIPLVPVLLAEDETAIIANIEYASDRDVLQGFCGRISVNHQCVENCEPQVGVGEEGYNNIVSAFQDYKIGTHARAMIINPLHPDLPKITVLVHPTCNRFDSAFVRDQWHTYSTTVI